MDFLMNKRSLRQSSWSIIHLGRSGKVSPLRVAASVPFYICCSRCSTIVLDIYIYCIWSEAAGPCYIVWCWRWDQQQQPATTTLNISGTSLYSLPFSRSRSTIVHRQTNAIDPLLRFIESDPIITTQNIRGGHKRLVNDGHRRGDSFICRLFPRRSFANVCDVTAPSDDIVLALFSVPFVYLRCLSLSFLFTYIYPGVS